MFKLDLSKFKKVSSDKDKTTLKHELGHIIQIAHVALSPKVREQLHALPMAKGGDPTQQHLLPGDKLPNSIERGVVNQARAKMADGGKPNDQLSGLGPDKPGSDAYKQHAAMQQGAGYPAPTPSATPDPYKMAEGGVPVPGSKYPSSSGQYSDPIGPTNFQPKNVPGSKYPTSTGQYGAGTGGKAGSKAMPDDRDEAFAKGGFVNNPKLAESKKLPPKNQWSSINQQAQDDRQPVKMFADGGPSSQMPDPSDQIVQDAAANQTSDDSPSQAPADVANQNSQVPDTSQGGSPVQRGANAFRNAADAAFGDKTGDPDTLRRQELYNQTAASHGNGTMFDQKGKLYGEFNPDVAAQADKLFTREQQQKAAQAQNGTANNALAAKFGAPQAVGNDQSPVQQIGPPPMANAPQQAQAGANSPGPQEPTDMPGIWKEGFNQQMQGIGGQANATETTEAAKTLALQHAGRAEQVSGAADWHRSQNLLNDAYKVTKEIDQGMITPEDLEPPGGSGFFNKLKTGIGMMLGGAGAWATGGNMYADWINKQIDRHVNAQKSNQSMRSNLLTHYSTMMGDNDKAAQMYSGIMHNAAADMVAAQGANYNSLAAQSVKNELEGGLRQKGAMMLSMGSGSGTSGMPGQGAAPNARLISQMEIANPELGKEWRARYEPSVDAIATRPLTAEDHANIEGHQVFQDAIQHAIQFANQHRGKIVGPDAATAQAIQTNLGNSYRAITGGGKSAAELNLVDNVISGNLNSPINQWSTIPKLQEVGRQQAASQAILHKSLGLPLPGEAPPQVTAPGAKFGKTFRPFGK